MYYLSTFKKKEKEKSNLVIAKDAGLSTIDNASRAFVGLAITAKATPKKALAFQLKEYKPGSLGEKILGKKGLLGNLRQQTIDQVLKADSTEAKLIPTGGKKLKDYVAKKFKKGLKIPLNTNFPLQSKASAIVGVGAGAYTLGKGLYDKYGRKKNK